MTLTDIITHPIKSYSDLDALIMYAEHNGGGGVVCDRIWNEIVTLHQRIEEMGGNV